MESIAFALIFIAFIAAGFFVWYFSFKAKQEERRFLIEKGYKLEELPASASFNVQLPWMKLGIVMVGAVLGWLFIVQIFNIYKGTVPALILGAGMGMILAQAIENGYKFRTVWRKVVFGLLGLGTGGVTASILIEELLFDRSIGVFMLMLCFALALFIEHRTQKSTEPGE